MRGDAMSAVAKYQPPPGPQTLEEAARRNGITGPGELDELLDLVRDLIVERPDRKRASRLAPDWNPEGHYRHARIARQAMHAGLIDDETYRELCSDGGQQTCICDGSAGCRQGCTRGYHKCRCEVCALIPEDEGCEP